MKLEKLKEQLSSSLEDKKPDFETFLKKNIKEIEEFIEAEYDSAMDELASEELTDQMEEDGIDTFEAYLEYGYRLQPNAFELVADSIIDKYKNEFNYDVTDKELYTGMIGKVFKDSFPHDEESVKSHINYTYASLV